MTSADVAAYYARIGAAQKFEKSAVEPPESSLHNHIIKRCNALGFLYFHGSMAHKAMRTSGEPDFTICMSGGRVVFLECKSKTGKMRFEQVAVQAHMEKLNCRYYVVRTKDEVDAILVP